MEEENQRLKKELEDARNELFQARKELQELKKTQPQNPSPQRWVEEIIAKAENADLSPLPSLKPLSRDDICRYSRQLLTPEIGAQGQSKLKATSMLVVGAGGLGAPLLQYLGAAGVGRLGVIDSDVVSVDNLHRQVIHREENVGIPKVYSAVKAINELNPSIEIIPYNKRFTSEVALDLVSKYDIVIDATDNVPTRYLINDSCMMLGKPLVSGSALRMEGQVTIYGLGGPCYRCIFPKPPPPEAVTNCSDGGVLGVVPGIIGCIQALEAIKIATGGPSLSQKMLVFDGSTTRFRTIQLRGRNPQCIACGEQEHRMKSLIDYQEYCQAPLHDQGNSISVLGTQERITCTVYKSIIEAQKPHVLIDVRPELEYQICHLDNSMNIHKYSGLLHIL
eukprot:TRINITY_DN5903_c0_g1_i4.p1 TRINITY_DN5903_c0_g1~~TRINITY_DN5903_c0_g1_i4.p1  ORF type:complete len:392 (-),score=75.35 TRINITY_DN5903_c0_g1_i4:592-1767(-)